MKCRLNNLFETLVLEEWTQQSYFLDRNRWLCFTLSTDCSNVCKTYFSVLYDILNGCIFPSSSSKIPNYIMFSFFLCVLTLHDQDRVFLNGCLVMRSVKLQINLWDYHFHSDLVLVNFMILKCRKNFKHLN